MQYIQISSTCGIYGTDESTTCMCSIIGLPNIENNAFHWQYSNTSHEDMIRYAMRKRTMH